MFETSSMISSHNFITQALVLQAVQMLRTACLYFNPSYSRKRCGIALIRRPFYKILLGLYLAWLRLLVHFLES